MDNNQTPLSSRKDVATWLRQQPYSQNLNDGVLFCRIMQKSYPAYFIRLNELPRSEFEALSNFKMLNRCLDKNGLYAITDVQLVLSQLERFATNKDFFEFANWLKNFVERNQSQLTGSAMHLLQRSGQQQPVPTVPSARNPILTRVKTAGSMSNSSASTHRIYTEKSESDIAMATSNRDLRGFLQDSDSYLRREGSQKKPVDNGSFLKDVIGSPILSALHAPPPQLPPRDVKKAPVEAVIPITQTSTADLYQVHQNDTKSLLQLYALETDVEYFKETLQQLKHAIETGRSVQDIKNQISSRLFDKVMK